MSGNPPPLNVIITASDQTRQAVESARNGFEGLKTSAGALQGILAGGRGAARLSETLGADDCAVVVAREHLAGALGVGFGGIATRCGARWQGG